MSRVRTSNSRFPAKRTHHSATGRQAQFWSLADKNKVIICTKKMVNAETVVKKRHYNKKERAKRRKQLGLHEESEARKTKEFCQKVKERTQNMQEFLKVTGRKPEQRLLEVGSVAKIQQNNGNESLETEGSAIETKSGREGTAALIQFWEKFGKGQSEEIESEDNDIPKYPAISEIFGPSKETVMMEVPEKDQLCASEKCMEQSEKFEASIEFELPDVIEQECLTDSQMTVNSDYTDNLAEPLYIEEPAKSDEHSSKNEEEEELLNQLYGQLNIPERINGESDVIDMDNSDELHATKEPSEQRDVLFSDMIQAMRDERKREAERKLSEEKQTEAEKKAQKVQKSKAPKVPAKKIQVKNLKKATASKMKSASTLDEYEIEAMRKVGIKIGETEEGKVQKDQNDEKTQNMASNDPKNVQKPVQVDIPKTIQYRFQPEDLVRGKEWKGEMMRSGAVYKNEKVSLCLIIAIGEEHEMDADVSNITQLFQKLNYSVQIASDLTADGIEKTLEQFAKNENHGDSTVLFFLVHGNQQGMKGSDEKIFELRRVFEYLSPHSAPKLAGKPKLVFFEHCRGGGRDSGYTIQQDTEDVLERSGRASGSTKQPPTIIPGSADFLISFATSAGSYAYATKTHGSFHIQALVQMIAEQAYRSHLEEILLEVRRRVSGLEINGPDGKCKQMPQTTSTLTMPFYFALKSDTRDQKSMQ
ncbi:unnamed protein product [Caenorhabditis nigoni]